MSNKAFYLDIKRRQFNVSENMLHQENIKITMVRGGSKWRDKNFIFFSEGLILLFIFLIISSQLKSEKRKEEKIFSWGVGLPGYG